jgi:hypothetical protein
MSGSFAGMVDEDHRGLMAALEAAEVVEQGCNFSGHVLVDAVQPDEGVEYEQGRMQGADSIFEALSIELKIEPQGWSGDDQQIEIGEEEVGSGTDPLETLADSAEGILGGEEEGATLLSNGKAA